MFFSNFIRFDLEVGCISIIKNSFLINSKFFNEKSLYSYPSISHKTKEGDFCNFETNSFLKLFELISP